MMRQYAVWGIVVAVSAAAACASETARSPETPPPVDAAPEPDAPPRPEPKPLSACEARVEQIDLGVTEQVERGTFYASAFYFRTRSGVHRRRLGGTTQTLVRDGQLYPRLGDAATLHVRSAGYSFEFQRPTQGFACGLSLQLPLTLDYRLNKPGGFGQIVVLVDDLTQQLTHVLATGDTYDGELVEKVFVTSQDVACGPLTLEVTLASGRELVVQREPTSQQLTTLLSVAQISERVPGQPIEGAPDRFVGRWIDGSLHAGQLNFRAQVQNGAAEFQGLFMGSLDLAMNKITCRITDTDIPCVVRRPDFTRSQAWSQAGETAAVIDTILTVVRGDTALPALDGGFDALVCAQTGDVFFPRRSQPHGFDNSVIEVYVLRRSGAIERVTRNLELDLAGGPRSPVFDGYELTDQCDLIQNVRTPGGESRPMIYWKDGVFGLGPSVKSYLKAGSDGDSSVAMMSWEGEALVIRQPTGDCRVPADVFPAPAK